MVRSFFADFYSGKTGDPLIDENLNHSNYTLASVVPAILLQPSLLGVHFGSDGPLWSIACEVFYYAAYPAFALIWIKNRLLAYVVAMSVGLSCWIYPWAGYWSGTVSYFPIWILGALLAEQYVAHHSKFDIIAFVIALFLSGVLFLAINLNLPEKVLLTCRMGMALAATTLFVSLPKWLSTKSNYSIARMARSEKLQYLRFSYAFDNVTLRMELSQRDRTPSPRLVCIGWSDCGCCCWFDRI
ncbi:MAG: hypothetical protein U0930_12695 [Pirellulales bacterium]